MRKNQRMYQIEFETGTIQFRMSNRERKARVNIDYVSNKNILVFRDDFYYIDRQLNNVKSIPFPNNFINSPELDMTIELRKGNLQMFNC